MSPKERLRTVFCCLTLEVAAFFGAPMRPEQIRELMQTMNEPKIARTLPADEDNGGDPPEASGSTRGIE